MSAVAAFEAALVAHGLLPRTVAADGRLRRCPTADKRARRNGAYVLHPDGRGYFMNWAVDAGMQAWQGTKAPGVQPDARPLWPGTHSSARRSAKNACGP